MVPHWPKHPTSTAAPATSSITVRPPSGGQEKPRHFSRRAGRRWWTTTHPSNTFALTDSAIAHGRMQHAEIIYRRLPDDAREADTPDDLTKRARAKMALDPLLS